MPALSPTLKEDRTHGTHSFRCALYTVAPESVSFHVTPHWHDEIEILYFQKGHFKLEINMESYAVEDECFFFINAGELHRITCNEPCQESAVVFSPYLLSFVSNDAAQSDILSPLTRQNLLLPRKLLPEQSGFTEIKQEFLQLTKQFSSEETTVSKTGQLFIKASLLNILAHLSRLELLHSNKLPRSESIEGIKTVLSHIHDHYNDKIYIGELAELLNLNEQYFCRFFKKAIGQTPIAYINQYRIRHAVTLLENTSLPVTDICLECGFNNIGNFLREFRKSTGYTPLQYRNDFLSQKSK